LSALLRNRWFWLFVLACAASLALLAARGADLADALVSLALLGLALPLIALAGCAGLPTPGTPAVWGRGEARTLLGLIAFVAAVLVVKQPLLAAMTPAGADPRYAETLNALFKLVVFVGVPLGAYRLRHGGLPAAGEVRASRARLAACFVLLAAVAWALQALLSNEFGRLLARQRPAGVWLCAALACFAWNAVEAGLVEEFFFRRVLQSRLRAWSGSEVSALFLGALIFGLAHLPGIWLRGQGVSEGLGAAPSPLTTAAYVIVTQGVAGLMFGVLWARTRSLALLVLVHGMFDTPSNLARFMDVWGF